MNKKEVSEFNDLNFLKEFKIAISYNENIAIKKIALKHKVKNISAKTKSLIDGGIIKKNGIRRYPKWQWISEIDPNISMVRKMQVESSQVLRNEAAKSFEKRQKETMPEIDFDELKKSSDDTVNITLTKRGGARPGAGRKTKAFEQSEVKETKEISILWGMFKLKTTK